MIGVITSPTGAVIRDILHRLADRFPRHVLVWPVRVQGDGSAEEVAAAIRGFNALPADGPIRRPDLLIVARGGGSLEDLWSFNEEIVVRAAAASMIPLISAVGHETDVTLIDFAADVRAPTPTAAAEMAVPVRAELLVRVDSLARRVARLLASLPGGPAHRAARGDRAPCPPPRQLLALPRQRLDQASARLPRALIANAQLHHRQFSRRGRPAWPADPDARAWAAAANWSPRWWSGRERAEERRAAAPARAAGDRDRPPGGGLAGERRRPSQPHRPRSASASPRWPSAASVRRGSCFDTALTSLERCGQLLTALSHRGVLARGFALVRDLDGRPLRQAAAVNAGMRLDIEFSDGHVRALAEGSTAAPAGKSEPVPATKPRGRRGGGDSGQGSLFDA